MRRWLCALLRKMRKEKLREEELWRQCQKEENLKKQVQVHLEQVKKHEHNLEKQKMMLADVQLRLESVSLEVKALRALVAGTKEPEGPPIQAPPPCPREPPPEDVDGWLRHRILMMMIWRRGMLNHGRLLVLKRSETKFPLS